MTGVQTCALPIWKRKDIKGRRVSKTGGYYTLLTTRRQFLEVDLVENYFLENSFYGLIWNKNVPFIKVSKFKIFSTRMRYRISSEKDDFRHLRFIKQALALLLACRKYMTFRRLCLQVKIYLFLFQTCKKTLIS